MEPKFTRFRHVLVDGLSTHATHHFASGKVAQPGEVVLEIGCGWGDDSARLALAVGPEGRVCACDCTEAFVDAAKRELPAELAGRLCFVCGDAEREDFSAQGPYDLIYSRFSTMFFQNPVRALKNVSRCLKDDGRVFLITWGPRDKNPWLQRTADWIHEVLPKREALVSCGPGPFSQTTPEVLDPVLNAAGLEVVEHSWHDDKVLIGRTIEEACDFALALGPAGETFREYGDEAKAKEAQIRAMFQERLKDQETADGIWFPAQSMLTIAKKKKT